MKDIIGLSTVIVLSSMLFLTTAAEKYRLEEKILKKGPPRVSKYDCS